MEEIEKKLSEIEKRCEVVPSLPYKFWPVVFCGTFEGEKTEKDIYDISNDILNLGLNARTDIPKLLSALRMACEWIGRQWCDCLHLRNDVICVRCDVLKQIKEKLK